MNAHFLKPAKIRTDINLEVYFNFKSFDYFKACISELMFLTEF